MVRLFERDIFPWMGDRPIADVTAPEVLAVVHRIECRGAVDTAHRALGNCGQVFPYAIATGRTRNNPAADLRGALPPAKGEHFAATTAEATEFRPARSLLSSRAHFFIPVTTTELMAGCFILKLNFDFPIDSSSYK
jgi:hypothetical protein